jgi:DHA1 family purine ribonucleoside efflux pump-like MFS transporter
LVIQFVTLPRGASAPSGGLRALGTVLKSRIVIAGLLASLLIFSGHFSGFTYIRPAATDLSDVPASTFALVLLVFGGSLFLGTALSGPLADRLPRLGRIFFPGVLGLGMLVMLLLGTSTTGLFVAAVIWGFGFGGVPTTLLSWGAHAEPSRLEQIGGVIVAVCNLGIAAGAAVGGVIVDTATPSTPLLVGGIASIVGAVLLSALPQRR